MRQFVSFYFVLIILGYSAINHSPSRIALGKPVLQDTTTVYILWPPPGQALLGNIAITGSTAVDGFRTAEILFGYANDPTGTWFLITQSDIPVQNDELAEWDTTVITDGNYNLKLSVSLESGELINSVVHGVRVRNYSPIETNTPTPVTPTSTQVPGDTSIPTITPTATITPIPSTPTPLPTNPVMLTSTDIVAGFGKGIVAVFLVFLLLGGYLGIRGALRNRI